MKIYYYRNHLQYLKCNTLWTDCWFNYCSFCFHF